MQEVALMRNYHKHTTKLKLKRKMISFNPPYNMNVVINISSKHLSLLRCHFPNKYYKPFSTITLKTTTSSGSTDQISHLNLKHTSRQPLPQQICKSPSNFLFRE